ncbi:acyltransferase [Akkermansiaceae bacterium]|nr:acyltransferase [Akkermansiaceae bacterium]MDB4387609.1 acyltransferase [Akkermansiaceae bacterium]
MVKYWNQLDGLRGIAIFGVLFAHFVTPHVDLVIPLGSWGVRLFFVLSGFLITGILLRVKKDVAEGHQSLAYTLKAFYIRRSLRIFTIFYLWNIAMLLFGFPFKDTFWWHMLYLTNWYNIIIDGGNIGTAGHYWSLAVEEQFYLVWPLLVLVIRECYLRKMFVLIIFGAIALRGVMAFNDVEYLMLKQNTILCLDSLAMGSLLAWCYQAGAREFDALQMILRRATLWMGLPILGLCLWWVNHSGKNEYYSAMMHASCAVCFGFVVGGAVKGYSGYFGRFLESKFLGHIGRVSYCIYIIHLFVPSIIRKVQEVLGVSILEIHWMFDAIIISVISFVIAFASWHLIESPVNKLKDRFPMRQVSTEN